MNARRQTNPQSMDEHLSAERSRMPSGLPKI